MAATKLSPTMRDAISFANEHGGKLTRYPGGFWCQANLKTWARPWFGTTTIEALVKRGVAMYTQWFEGSRARFPVEVTMLEKNEWPDYESSVTEISTERRNELFDQAQRYVTCSRCRFSAPYETWQARIPLPSPPADAVKEAQQLVASCTETYNTERGWGASISRINESKIIEAIATALTARSLAQVEGERITAEMLLEQLRFIPDLTIEPCCELHILEVLKTALVNARADGRAQPCPNCTKMQQALTQTARANRSLEKQCAEAQKGREAIAKEVEALTRYESCYGGDNYDFPSADVHPEGTYLRRDDVLALLNSPD